MRRCCTARLLEEATPSLCDKKTAFALLDSRSNRAAAVEHVPRDEQVGVARLVFFVCGGRLLRRLRNKAAVHIH